MPSYIISHECKTSMNHPACIILKKISTLHYVDAVIVADESVSPSVSAVSSSVVLVSVAAFCNCIFSQLVVFFICLESTTTSW